MTSCPMKYEIKTISIYIYIQYVYKYNMYIDTDIYLYIIHMLLYVHISCDCLVVLPPLHVSWMFLLTTLPATMLAFNTSNMAHDSGSEEDCGWMMMKMRMLMMLVMMPGPVWHCFSG